MEKKEQLQKQINVLTKIREQLGMNRTQFSHYMDIPLRTLEEWEAGRRKMPDYVLGLIMYYARTEKFLKEQGVKKENSSSFFRNFECDSFPCHKVENSDDFNCLFCYCPLYYLESCGGNYCFTEGGIKDCSNCTLPHKAKNYQYVVNTLKR